MGTSIDFEAPNGLKGEIAVGYSTHSWTLNGSEPTLIAALNPALAAEVETLVNKMVIEHRQNLAKIEQEKKDAAIAKEKIARDVFTAEVEPLIPAGLKVTIENSKRFSMGKTHLDRQFGVEIEFDPKLWNGYSYATSTRQWVLRDSNYRKFRYTSLASAIKAGAKNIDEKITKFKGEIQDKLEKQAEIKSVSEILAEKGIGLKVETKWYTDSYSRNNRQKSYEVKTAIITVKEDDDNSHNGSSLTGTVTSTTNEGVRIYNPCLNGTVTPEQFVSISNFMKNLLNQVEVK